MNGEKIRPDGAVIIVRGQKKYVDDICRNLRKGGVAVTERFKTPMWKSIGVILDIDCGRSLRNTVVPVLERAVNESEREGTRIWVLAYAVWFGRGYSETFWDGFFNFEEGDDTSINVYRDKIDRIFVHDLDNIRDILDEQGFNMKDLETSEKVLKNVMNGLGKIKPSLVKSLESLMHKPEPGTIIRNHVVAYVDEGGEFRILGRVMTDPETKAPVVTLPEVAFDKTDRRLASRVFTEGVLTWTDRHWVHIGCRRSSEEPTDDAGSETKPNP